MKVLKFGGTSVGTVDSLRNVIQIVSHAVASAQDGKAIIVVVSALGGITDRLIETGRLASTSGSSAYMETFASIISRHHQVIEGIVPEAYKAKALSEVDALLDELANIYRGVSLIQDLSPRTLDRIVSYGERMSTAVIKHILPSTLALDSRKFIKTVRQFDKHVLDADATSRLIAENFTDNVLSDNSVILVPGFISTDAAGDITNLGRGGSDYTAAILAAGLNADSLEIWTDVDGFLTADPRKVNGTYVIDKLSFIEAMELCNFGAKVIYPPTIYPVFHKNIPIYIKNTFNPTAPGTRICDDDSLQHAGDNQPLILKGISSINDTCLIKLSGIGISGGGINTRLFNALARNGVSVFMVSQDNNDDTIGFAVRNNDIDRAVAAVDNEFMAEMQTGEFNPVQVDRNLATVAIVGENMQNNICLTDRLFDTLGSNNISIRACAQGASETNLSFVIDLGDENRTLNVLHDSFFLS